MCVSFNVDADAWNMEFITDGKNACILLELLRYKNREGSENKSSCLGAFTTKTFTDYLDIIK